MTVLRAPWKTCEGNRGILKGSWTDESRNADLSLRIQVYSRSRTGKEGTHTCRLLDEADSPVIKAGDTTLYKGSGGAL